MTMNSHQICGIWTVCKQQVAWQLRKPQHVHTCKRQQKNETTDAVMKRKATKVFWLSAMNLMTAPVKRDMVWEWNTWETERTKRTGVCKEKMADECDILYGIENNGCKFGCWLIKPAKESVQHGNHILNF